MENYKIPANNGLNSGLIYEPPQEPDHVVGGVTVGGLLVEKPQPISCFKNKHGWNDVKSGNRGEVQSNDNFDSFSCTIFTSLKCLSDYMFQAYNFNLDAIESFNAVMAGVTPGIGGTVRNALESIRKNGWLSEELTDTHLDLKARLISNDCTQAQFFAPYKQIYIDIAKKALIDWTVYWDWIDTSDNVPHQKIIDNFEFTDAVLTGYAWASYYGNSGVFFDYNYQANHCFKGGDFKEKDPIVDLLADDSYRFDWNVEKSDHTDLQDFIKPLAKSYRIWSAHRIWAVPNIKNKNTLLAKFKKLMENLWTYADSHGIHFYFVKKLADGSFGKQLIDVNQMTTELRALYIALGQQGLLRTTNWPEISKIKDYKFF